ALHDRRRPHRLPGTGGVMRRSGWETGRNTAAGASGAEIAAAASAAAAMVDAGRRLAAAGLIAGPDGNLSVRLGGDRVLVTPAGAGKGTLEPGDLVVVDMDGRVVDGDDRPSSELAVHLAIYRARADARAVVHAHPPTATGFALAGEDFMAPLLPEIILQMGGVPLVPYSTPGSSALADAVAGAVGSHEAALLANHGAVTLGATLELALQRMESLEHAARIILTARLVGRAIPLTPEQVQALHALREAARRDGASTFAQEIAR
ncbi:MAG: class II aldolase/adducin family protein, partial [Gemmatimonadaceae bacterium]